MTTIDATLRGAVAGAGNDLTLTLDPALQGLPDTAHGGSVLALFDVLAARSGRRTLRGHYHRRVPLGVPLSLRLAREADGLGCRVADGAVLVGGERAATRPRAGDRGHHLRRRARRGATARHRLARDESARRRAPCLSRLLRVMRRRARRPVLAAPASLQALFALDDDKARSRRSPLLVLRAA